MTDDDRLDLVATRMASHYGLDFTQLKENPVNEGFHDLESKQFWREIAAIATDAWEKSWEGGR